MKCLVAILILMAAVAFYWLWVKQVIKEAESE